VDRVRLDSSSVMRATEAVKLRLHESTVSLVCAALETSRGVVLVGSLSTTGRLAQALGNEAQRAGYAAGLYRLAESDTVEIAVRRLQLGDWLFLEELSAPVIEPLLSALAGMLDLRAELSTARAWIESPTWRLLLAFEPQCDQRLPPIPVDRRRHFPLVEVQETG
jgi:hypothetical protein